MPLEQVELVGASLVDYEHALTLPRHDGSSVANPGEPVKYS